MAETNKLNNLTIWEGFEVLQRFLSDPKTIIPAVPNLAITNRAKQLAEYCQQIREQIVKLANDYGDKEENGSLKQGPNGEIPQFADPTSDKFKEYKEKYVELMSAESEIEIKKIPISKLEHVEIPSTVMIPISFLFSED